jgi:hypothetical protein
MNNHIPDAGKMVCPFCGLPQIADSPNGTKFNCGTMVWKIGTPNNRRSQSNGCTESERDQLRARVEGLKRERDHANDMSCALLKENASLRQRVEKLENWCQRMANMLDEAGWESRSQNEFRKYMETKPKPEGLR